MFELLTSSDAGHSGWSDIGLLRTCSAGVEAATYQYLKLHPSCLHANRCDSKIVVSLSVLFTIPSEGMMKS